jgi:beta-aspartyl-peptidase (threonine type)
MQVVVMEKLVKIGGEGGMIGVDANAQVAMVFNSTGMYRAAKRSSMEKIIAIYR